MVIFLPHLPLSYIQHDSSSRQPCFPHVTSAKESITDGDGVGLTPACQQGRKWRVWSSCTREYTQHASLCACVCLCMFNKASHSWQCLSRGERKRERGSSPFLSLLVGENVTMHQSVWLLTQNTAIHPHADTHTHTHGREVWKLRRRKGENNRIRRRMEGEERRRLGEAICSSVLLLTITNKRNEENSLGEL